MTGQTKLRSPAFRWYPADFMADMNVQLMTWEQRGIYVWLLGICWLEGFIPADFKSLSILTKTTLRWWNLHGDAIKRCFIEHKKGQLIHQRIERERIKQQNYRENRIRSGKLGAKNKWDKYASNKDISGTAIDLPMANDGREVDGTAKVLPMANDGFSFSSSFSNNNIITKSSNNIIKRKRTKSRFVPEDFQITEDLKAWAKSQRPDLDIDKEIEKFKDWEFQKPRSDWDRTFRNWIRNSKNYGTNKPGSKKGDRRISDYELDFHPEDEK